MSVPSIEFLRNHFPTLFARGVAILEARAAEGDEQAQRILADVKGVTGAVALHLGDEARVVLSAKEGSLTPGDKPDAGVPLKAIAKLPSDAVQLLLGEAMSAGALENDKIAVGAAQTASKRFEDALAGQPMTMRATVLGVPELGDVTLDLAFNVSELPAEPGFTTEVQYADLDAARRGELTPQDLFLGGKLKMEGDYSLALQISMQLLTNPI